MNPQVARPATTMTSSVRSRMRRGVVETIVKPSADVAQSWSRLRTRQASAASGLKATPSFGHVWVSDPGRGCSGGADGQSVDDFTEHARVRGDLTELRPSALGRLVGEL